MTDRIDEALAKCREFAPDEWSDYGHRVFTTGLAVIESCKCYHPECLKLLNAFADAVLARSTP